MRRPLRRKAASSEFQMHDCNKFKDKIVDLLFECADRDNRSRLFAEVAACKNCDSLYRSMSETLTVFDQATRTAEPEEAYWIGYRNRLQAQLNARPKQDSFAPLFSNNMLARLPMALRVAFACLVLAAGLWLLLSRIGRTNPPASIAIDSIDPSRDEQPPGGNKTHDEKRDPIQKHTIVKGPRHIPAHVAPNVKPDSEIELAQAGDKSDRHSGSSSYLKIETASHLEQAELLMRSFRNMKLSEDPTAMDVSYEKQFSKQLLATNRRLRRSAENKRVLSVEDLLTGIEPLLLDIANLPDNPAEDAVRSIKELIQKQEVVATLQLYSAKASSRNFR
jgi:hypothetical protein